MARDTRQETRGKKHVATPSFSRVCLFPNLPLVGITITPHEPHEATVQLHLTEGGGNGEGEVGQTERVNRRELALQLKCHALEVTREFWRERTLRDFPAVWRR